MEIKRVTLDGEESMEDNIKLKACPLRARLQDGEGNNVCVVRKRIDSCPHRRTLTEDETAGLKPKEGLTNSDLTKHCSLIHDAVVNEKGRDILDVALDVCGIVGDMCCRTQAENEGESNE